MRTGESEELAGKLDRVALLIPAWQPRPELVPLVRSLLEYGVGAVVVVDDGSRGCEEIFEQLHAMPRVHDLRHGLNLGKGRALKTGMNYCLRRLTEFRGIVTADADGQHTCHSILCVAEALLAEGRAVLGSRVLDSGVPFRSRIGNMLARRFFGFATGTRLSDTQTGLRGFPQAMLPELVVLEGERYEYEMTVLAHLCRTGNKPLEIPVETVYLNGNRSSHFDPLRDALRIGSVLARLFVETGSRK